MKMKVKGRYLVYVIATVIVFLVGVLYFTEYTKPEQTIEERITVSFNGAVKDNISASGNNYEFQNYFIRDLQSIKHPNMKYIRIYAWGLTNEWAALDVEITVNSKEQTVQEIIDMFKSKWYTLNAYKVFGGCAIPEGCEE